MPPCHCDFAKCAGAVVSKQTFASHQRQDRVKRVQDALSTSEDACKKLDNAIASHLSKLSLDSTSQSDIRPTMKPEQGRACRPQNAHVAETESMLPPHVRSVGEGSPHRTTDPSYRQQVEGLLRRLAEIECAVEELGPSVESQLSRLGRPSHRDEVFPLTPALEAMMSVKDDLAHIQSKSPAVEVAKSSLSTQVSGLLIRLQQAKKSWHKQRKLVPLTEKSKAGTLTTGKLPHRFD